MKKKIHDIRKSGSESKTKSDQKWTHIYTYKDKRVRIEGRLISTISRTAIWQKIQADEVMRL
jgi:hypothetical protein